MKELSMSFCNFDKNTEKIMISIPDVRNEIFNKINFLFPSKYLIAPVTTSFIVDLFANLHPSGMP
jgi:hypothetical protein